MLIALLGILDMLLLLLAEPSPSTGRPGAFFQVHSGVLCGRRASVLETARARTGACVLSRATALPLVNVDQRVGGSC